MNQHLFFPRSQCRINGIGSNFGVGSFPRSLQPSSSPGCLPPERHPRHNKTKPSFFMTTKQLLLLGLLWPVVNAHAQQNKNSNDAMVPYAQASGSSVHGLDMFTGTGNVSVPIYSYSVDGVNMSISLGYSLKGLPLDMISGAHGLGWNLSAGGSIERTVKGIEDESVVPYKNNQPNAGKRYVGSWVSSSIDDRETEFDVFNLDLCGKNYQFTYNPQAVAPDVAWKVYPKSELTFQILDNIGDPNVLDYFSAPFYRDGSSHKISFIVTDEKRNRFYFEPGDYELTTRQAYSDTTVATDPAQTYNYQPVSRWLLTKVVSHTGQEIRLFYKEFSSSMPFYNSHEVRESFLGNTITVKKKPQDWIGKVFHTEHIEYPNGTKVYFDFDDNDPSKSRCDNPATFPLKSIRVSSGYDNNVRNTLTYRFNYAYFNSPRGGNNNTEIPYPTPCTDIANSYGGDPVEAMKYTRFGLRLKLKGIDRIGNDGVSVEPLYRFEYNNTPLAARLTPSKDYYGYYNGKSPVVPYPHPNCASLYNHDDLKDLAVPLHTVTLSCNNNNEAITYGLDRTPDINYLQAFLLKKVINGTGAETEFYFKDHVLTNPPNQYNQSSLPAFLQGQDANDGLCIDKIVVRDGFSADHTVTYQYTYAGGQRFYAGGWFWYPSIVRMGANNQWQVREQVYTEHFVSPQNFFNGSNHGYSTVTEKKLGYNNEILENRTFTFSNLIDYWQPGNSNLSFNYTPGADMLEHTFQPSRFDKYRVGLPIETTTYDPAGNLLSKKINYHSPVGYANGMEGQPTPNQASFGYKYIGGSNNSLLPDGTTQLYIPFIARKMRLDRVKTLSYIGGAVYADSMDYAYDQYDNLKNVAWRDSRGHLYRKHYNYLYNLHTTNNPKSAQYPLTETIWKVNSGSDSLLIDGNAASVDLATAETKFKVQSVSEVKNAELLDASLAGSENTLYYTAIGSALGSAALSPLIERGKEYMKYDSRGNVTETYETQVKADVAQLWDNRLGKKVAEVVNAKLEDIAYTSFEGPFAARTVPDDNKGNWDFEPSLVSYATAQVFGTMTGRYYYTLQNALATVTSNNTLKPNTKYIVTVWATQAPTLRLNNGSQQQTLTFHQQRQIDVWKLYTAVFIPAISNARVEVSGNQISIDELRLYPADAAMSTTTYEPLFGPNSVCDGLNNISYTDYDAFGRVKATRDIKGNYRSFVQTVNQGTDN